MPLMRYWNSLKSNNIYGYRGIYEDNRGFSFYYNEVKNEYYCDKIKTYLYLKNKKYLDIYIITNSLSYYNKYKHIYKVKFVDYFYYDDFIITKTDNILLSNTKLYLFANDFCRIFSEKYNKKEFRNHVNLFIDKIEKDFFISAKNSYLNKDIVNDDFNSYLEKKLGDRGKKYNNNRCLTENNCIIDLPMNNDKAMIEMNSVNFYPFHFRNFLEKQFFYVILSNYEENIDTYNYFVDKGYLKLIYKDDIVKFEVIKKEF